ncbi:hypothetical protein D3C87_1418820 [compost metagenome]
MGHKVRDFGVDLRRGSPGIEEPGGPVFLFGLRHLPGKQALHLFHGHTRPRHYALALHRLIDIGHGNGIKPIIVAAFEQERHFHRRQGMPGLFGTIEELRDALAHQRVHHRFETLEARGVGREPLRQSLPVNHAIPRYSGKQRLHVWDRGAGIEFCNGRVGREDRHSQLPEAFEQGRLARGDGAGDADPEHDQ